MVYKWCVVPQCTNTSIKTPEKLFINVPKNAAIRKKWLQLARRNPNDIVVNSNVFFCEDHFQMEKDIANYNQYKMGFSQRLLLADGALPSKFHCQQDCRKRLCNASTSRAAYTKRRKIEFIQEFCKDNQFTGGSVSGTSDQVYEKEVQEESEPIEPLQTHHYKEITTEPTDTAEKSIQINLKVNYRSKAVQTKIVTRDVSASPHKFSTSSKYTSPFKIIPCHLQPSTAGVSNLNKKLTLLDEEMSDSDVSFYAPPSLFKVSNSDTATDKNVDIEKIQSLQTTLKHIVNKPMMYVGIPKDSYYLVQIIHKHCKIPQEQILMCLNKIRLNSTFSVLEDNFGISLSYGSKLFLKNIPLIASVLRPFIVKLDKNLNKKNLPISFRHNYYNVSCIIDCLEIDIQKPSKALNQALTWSDYKKANTVKYLISCTPNGLINYISTGFGGRASDITIVESCNFLDELEPGSCVLADRGFKHIDKLLSDKGIKLLRPPSVASGSKLSKAEVRLTKIIASIRIHIERVIRRVRESSKC